MIKRSEQEWRDLFAQQVASGLTARQFCKANALCAKHFNQRKKQFDPQPISTPSAFVPIVPARTHVSQKVTAPALVLRHGNCSLYFDATLIPSGLHHYCGRLHDPVG